MPGTGQAQGDSTLFTESKDMDLNLHCTTYYICWNNLLNFLDSSYSSKCGLHTKTTRTDKQIQQKQDTRLTYRYLLHFFTLTMKYQKEKEKNLF